MIIVYILLAFLLLSSVRFNKNTEAVMSYDTTNSVKGIFILIVFISHSIPYITNAGYQYANWGDYIFKYISGFIGQWIVAMFLFYSGYGIMEAISRKGISYLDNFPKKRILNVLLNFDVAVLFFIITNILLDKHFTIVENILAFTGWTSVGNSNWYIFVILLCYVMALLVFRSSFIKTLSQKWLMFTVLSFVSIIVLYLLKPMHWYDTMLCFSFGMFFSLNKQLFYKFISSHYFSLLCLQSIILIPTYRYAAAFGGFSYNIFSMLFCLWVITITIKIDFGRNSFLKWCGNNLFPLYIYQRIPMIVFSSIGEGILPASYPVIYFALCFIFTLSIAHFYKYWVIKL